MRAALREAGFGQRPAQLKTLVRQCRGVLQSLKDGYLTGQRLPPVPVSAACTSLLCFRYLFPSVRILCLVLPCYALVIYFPLFKFYAWLCPKCTAPEGQHSLSQVAPSSPALTFQYMPSHSSPNSTMQQFGGFPLVRHLLCGLPSDAVTELTQTLVLLGPEAEHAELDDDEAPQGGWLQLLQGPSAAEQGARRPAPPALQAFMSSPQAQQLAAQALRKLDTACKLFSAGSSSGYVDEATLGRETRQGLSDLEVSPDVDFGLQPIVQVPAEELRDLMASVAAGTSLLEALQLAGGAEAVAASGSSHSRSALRMQHVTLRNTHSTAGMWILGGVAAPQLPHTFAALDDARLFWADSGEACMLGGGAL